MFNPYCFIPHKDQIKHHLRPQPFAPLFDVLLSISTVYLVFEFNSFAPFLLLALSPRAWK
jgi:hypothetical protein